MSKINFSKLLIPIALTGLIGYFLYTTFLKEIILNNSTQSIQIKDVGLSKAFFLTKLEGQTTISSLEIELSGNSAANLILVYGPSKEELIEQVQLKRGTIDFQKSIEWKADNCYFLVMNEIGEPVNLKLDYRFIH